MGLYALALVLIPFVVGAFALIMDRVERAIVNPPADTATKPAVASLPAAPRPTESASPTAGTSRAFRVFCPLCRNTSGRIARREQHLYRKVTVKLKEKVSFHQYVGHSIARPLNIQERLCYALNFA